MSTQTQQSQQQQQNPSGNPQTLSGNTGSNTSGNTVNNLSQDLQKTSISGQSGQQGQVHTSYDPNIQPPLAFNVGFNNGGYHYGGRQGSRRSRSSHFDRPSVFDLQSAYQKHHAAVQARHQSQYGQQTQGQTQQGQGQTQSSSSSATSSERQARADQEVSQTEADYKAAKEEEKAELVKFEQIRQHVNELISSQDWNQQSSSHVHQLGTKLRELERRFWDLKPAAEKLVLRGRNKLAESVDLAEEELLHAIVVVSEIYRTRVKDAAHAKYPGKVHPKYLAEHHAAQQQAHFHASQFDQGYGGPGYGGIHHHHRQQGGYGGGYGGGFGGPSGHRFGHPGHGHPGHPGYAGHEDFGVVPYHGHPHQGYGGYY